MNSDKDDGYVLYRRHHSGPHGIRLEGDPGTTTPIVRTPHCPPARTYYLNASRSPAALGGVDIDPQRGFFNDFLHSSYARHNLHVYFRS